MTTPIDPPTEATQFLDRLHAAFKRVRPGSEWVWLPHPTKKGQWVVGVVVEVEERPREEGAENDGR